MFFNKTRNKPVVRQPIVEQQIFDDEQMFQPLAHEMVSVIFVLLDGVYADIEQFCDLFMGFPL